MRLDPSNIKAASGRVLILLLENGNDALTTEKIDHVFSARFGKCLDKACTEALDWLLRQDLIEEIVGNSTCYRLTKKGLALAKEFQNRGERDNVRLSADDSSRRRIAEITLELKHLEARRDRLSAERDQLADLLLDDDTRSMLLMGCAKFLQPSRSVAVS